MFKNVKTPRLHLSLQTHSYMFKIQDGIWDPETSYMGLPDAKRGKAYTDLDEQVTTSEWRKLLVDLDDVKAETPVKNTCK